MRNNLLPPHGNPVRPLLILLAVALSLMLVLSPVVILLSGDGTGAAAKVTLLIGLITVVTLGAVWAVAALFQSDQALLLSGEVLAEWELSPEEHLRFLAAERRQTQNLAMWYGTVGTVAGVVVMPFNLAFGIIMVVVFVGIALMILLLERLPPAAESDAGRAVLIGWGGAQVLGRYRPIEAPQLRLTRMELEHGDPTVLRFRLLERHRPKDVRVPVPRERVAEAEALIQRFRDAGLLRH